MKRKKLKIEQENPVVEEVKPKRKIGRHSLHLGDPRFVCSVDLTKYIGLSPGTLNKYCSRNNIELKTYWKILLCLYYTIV